MAKKTRDVDLYAQFLGLERTLEDDILDLMEEYVKDTADSVIGGVIQERGGVNQKEEIKAFIRDVVFEVLKEVLGTDLIGSRSSSRSFKQQLFYELEKNGFVRDCPTCYFNTMRLGKMKRNNHE